MDRCYASARAGTVLACFWLRWIKGGEIEWASSMTNRGQRVIHLHQRDPQEALERLNRLTGLRFSQWPESLLAQVERQGSDAQNAVEVAAAKVLPG